MWPSLTGLEADFASVCLIVCLAWHQPNLIVVPVPGTVEIDRHCQHTSITGETIKYDPGAGSNTPHVGQ